LKGRNLFHCGKESGGGALESRKKKKRQIKGKRRQKAMSSRLRKIALGEKAARRTWPLGSEWVAKRGRGQTLKGGRGTPRNAKEARKVPLRDIGKRGWQ